MRRLSLFSPRMVLALAAFVLLFLLERGVIAPSPAAAH